MEAPDRRRAATSGRPDVSPRDYLPTLDGWRAVAILWVMVCHDQTQLFQPGGLVPSRFLERVADRGRFGVDVFFGISGLLIGSRLLAERARPGRIDLAGFYLRRSARILPAALAYLGVVGLLATAGVVALDPVAYGSCFLFLRNYIPEPYMSRDPLTAHFWSLAVEEHFYLLWPLALGALATVARSRRFAFAAAVAIVVWSFLDFHAEVSTRFLRLPINHHYWRTDYSLRGLLLGCWMAALLADPTWRDRLAHWLAPAAWWGLLATFLALTIGVRENASRPIAALIVPILLAGTVLRPGLLAGRALEWAPLRWVGRISYSLYLWQQLFLLPTALDRPLGRLNAFPLDWIAALTCACASHYLIERPAIARGRALMARRRPGRSHAPAIRGPIVAAARRTHRIGG